MLEDGKITAQQAAEARDQPIQLEVAHDPDSLAPYFVEEIRRYLEGKYGSDQVHEGGLRVYTSLDMDLQRAANRAVFDGLAAYERRHGWRGHLQNVLSGGCDRSPTTSIRIGIANPRSTATSTPWSLRCRSASATVRFGRYTATLAPG